MPVEEEEEEVYIPVSGSGNCACWFFFFVVQTVRPVMERNIRSRAWNDADG